MPDEYLIFIFLPPFIGQHVLNRVMGMMDGNDENFDVEQKKVCWEMIIEIGSWG